MEIIDAITVLMSYGLITKISPSAVLSSGVGGNTNMLANMLNNLGSFNMQNMNNSAGRSATNDAYSHNNNNHHNHSHHQQQYHNGNQNGNSNNNNNNNYHQHNPSHMQHHQNNSQHHHHYQHHHHHNMNGTGVSNNSSNLGNGMHHFSSSKVKK